jgi:hypothetical protein
MKPFLHYLLIAVFSIFIGSQITEGVLLVPYWQSLSSVDFYAYYDEFGPSIGKFYTVLTVIAAFIPIVLSVYCKLTNSNALKFSLISSFFAIVFVSSFYIYFKETNELFYQAAFSDVGLKNELVTWSYWHWGRIVIEFISLCFLFFALNKVEEDS